MQLTNLPFSMQFIQSWVAVVLGPIEPALNGNGTYFTFVGERDILDIHFSTLLLGDSVGFAQHSTPSSSIVAVCSV